MCALFKRNRGQASKIRLNDFTSEFDFSATVRTVCFEVQFTECQMNERWPMRQNEWSMVSTHSEQLLLCVSVERPGVYHIHIELACLIEVARKS